MGESSACLIRSFSQPSSACNELKEGDPLRALTTSISFGRFMSESLAWEKFSRPGSVAEKKAYFEAHYKRIAAKKAAALLEQENASENNDLSESSVIDDTQNNSSKVTDERQREESSNTELGLSVGANASEHNAERNGLETDRTEGTKPVIEGAEPTIEQVVTMDNPVQIELFNERGNIEDSKMILTQQEKTPLTVCLRLQNKPNEIEFAHLDAANQGNLASTGKKKQANSSSNSCVNIQASKPQSSIKLNTGRRSKEDSATTNSKTTVKELVEKKRPSPNSLHTSINFLSLAGEASKTSPIIQKIGNSKIVRTFLRTSRDGQTPARASVNMVSEHCSPTPQPERTRSKTGSASTVSGRRTAYGKSKSPSNEHPKSSGASGHKARPTTVASSFSFRCEGRVAKRKEFFQKLEEKVNPKVAVKVDLLAKPKEKAGDDFKKLRQSGFKTIANSCAETESRSGCTKKIPLTRPRSPKLGRKPMPTTARDSVSQPPWRSSAKIEGSKHAMDKSTQTTIRSINSLLRKNVQENASPNIQV
ncbi:hypothetical protein NMG60_11024818 [Bertholletia excelsa]